MAATPRADTEYQVFEAGPDARLQAYYERMVDPRPLRVRSKAEWLERRAEVRQNTLAALALSPLPDRLPLEVHTGGALERDGYRVERLYWQTWPQVWASGWLYLPEKIEGRAPAILNPHGHWENGARHPVVQSRLISLAKLGYVTLAVDSVHLYDYAVGVTPLTAMTYNGLRALDLLISRPDVDRDRLGITGASGGAQQAMYLMAVDDRVKVAVLAVLVSYFKRILMPEAHHCPCNHVPGIMRFTDEPELCGIPSPRAVLYLTVTEDWTASFPDHERRELLALYRLWGQPDRLAHRQFPGPHDYNREMREAAYTWFERELRGDRKADPVTEPPHQVEDSAALAALDRPPPGNRGAEGILDWYRKRFIAQPPQLEGRQARRSYQERVKADLLELLGGECEAVTLETREERGSGRMEERESRGPVVERRHPHTHPPAPRVPATHPHTISFQTERDVRIPAAWLPPEEGPAPAVVLLHPEGKAAALRSRFAGSLREAGYALLAPDVRLKGEMARNWLHNTIIWGRPEAGMAAQDARACVEWLLGREEVDYRGITVVGEGDLGVVALLAAALDERITAVIADCCATTYRDGGEGLPVIPNILRVADVPQLASLVAPRPLLLYRVPAERVGFSSRRYYDWTRRTYQSLGIDEALRMTTTESPDPAFIAEWLGKRLRRARR